MTLETAANRAAGQNKNTAAYGQELDGRRHEPVREGHPGTVGQLQVSDSRGVPEAAAGTSNRQGAPKADIVRRVTARAHRARRGLFTIRER
jgi:hypothetical protein